MTYRQLIEQLQKLTEEQLDCSVTVEDVDYEECLLAEEPLGTLSGSFVPNRVGDFEIICEGELK